MANFGKYIRSGAILTVLTLLFVTFSFAGFTDKVRLNEDGMFVDSSSRVMLFHGFNTVVKRFPWYDLQMKNESRLKIYKNLGFNVVRLGLMWSGVMPLKSTVNQTYLEEIEKIVDLCEKYGLYVLLDMHQDELSSKFNSYDGVPLWLMNEFPRISSDYKYPWPFEKPPTRKFYNYLTYACAECAEQLYTNLSIFKYWGDFWEVVADRFKQKNNVLGYELINEPPMSNFYKRYESLSPAYVGKHHLLPVYDYLVKRIRVKDQQTLVFFEPMTYGIFYPRGTGFTHAPGTVDDPRERLKSVLSYHYYCWPATRMKPNSTMPWWMRIFCDQILLPEVMINTAETARLIGSGRFMTEFGHCAPDSNPLSINTIECNKVLDTADEQFESWTYWNDKLLDNFAYPVPTHIKVLSRCYPRTVSGHLLNMRFDPKSAYFFLKFNKSSVSSISSNIIAEIFIPRAVHYPHGFVVALNPPVLKYTTKGDILSIKAPFCLRKLTLIVEVVIMKREMQMLPLKHEVAYPTHRNVAGQYKAKSYSEDYGVREHSLFLNRMTANSSFSSRRLREDQIATL
ncbi:unnamed protein product [Calicophoron daubneyi]|uniref:Endoglycoceramidase n=1 Tax=Calicophoron daubneyi TaxID=300641 RepID=A0AAV2T5M7_CALDB